MTIALKLFPLHVDEEQSECTKCVLCWGRGAVVWRLEGRGESSREGKIESLASANAFTATSSRLIVVVMLRCRDSIK